MTAEIICVGTELLLGDIVNTNAQFLSRELAELGISVLHQHVIGDNPGRLRDLVKEAKSRRSLRLLASFIASAVGMEEIHRPVAVVHRFQKIVDI